MMNKVFRGFTIIIICVIILAGCNDMRFNQTTDKNDLITKKYSIAQIEELKNDEESENITFSKFKKNFDAQCVRKTHQGYYVVLLLEDGRNAFAFFNEKGLLIRVMISNGFMSEMEFRNRVTEQTTKSEVLNFDTNTIITPISAVEITVHIVREGIYIVKYSRFKTGKMVEDPIVLSIEFIRNENLSANEDLFIRNEVPFIFEIDKAN